MGGVGLFFIVIGCCSKKMQRLSYDGLSVVFSFHLMMERREEKKEARIDRVYISAWPDKNSKCQIESCKVPIEDNACVF